MSKINFFTKEKNYFFFFKFQQLKKEIVFGKFYKKTKKIKIIKEMLKTPDKKHRSVSLHNFFSNIPKLQAFETKPAEDLLKFYQKHMKNMHIFNQDLLDVL